MNRQPPATLRRVAEGALVRFKSSATLEGVAITLTWSSMMIRVITLFGLAAAMAFVGRLAPADDAPVAAKAACCCGDECKCEDCTCDASCPGGDECCCSNGTCCEEGGCCTDDASGAATCCTKTTAVSASVAACCCGDDCECEDCTCGESCSDGNCCCEEGSCCEGGSCATGDTI